MQSPTGNPKGGSPPVEPESDESDYEYEYDESERETFYINLDLTSCNGTIRPPRQRSAASSNSLVPSSQAQRMRSGGSSTGQAQFLECLMRAKRAKGEEDIVRTTFPQAQKRNQNIEERLQGWARTEGMLAELENVSQQARAGDPEAMKRLGEIYARFDAASRKNVGPETPATNAQSSTPLVQEHLPGDSALT
ncbi:hypothetical protein CIRG_01029 [Coccidioides immitis RMSCC 2394]|uniref:Uncharacterized protein n=1 Tax=Coccidioides immitis RMSCC 2394 TaxID=404692 RepID=A0A0J6Y2P4_COCIT|nr:hypothetical protein CIRG_01029 [Coccidioides immitis RMSCC 2394]